MELNNGLKQACCNQINWWSASLKDLLSVTPRFLVFPSPSHVSFLRLHSTCLLVPPRLLLVASPLSSFSVISTSFDFLRLLHFHSTSTSSPFWICSSVWKVKSNEPLSQPKTLCNFVHRHTLSVVTLLWIKGTSWGQQTTTVDAVVLLIQGSVYCICVCVMFAKIRLH